MMAGKYAILYSEYPYRGCYAGEYATNSLVKFIFKFVALSIKYPILDVQYRDVERMRDDS